MDIGKKLHSHWYAADSIAGDSLAWDRPAVIFDIDGVLSDAAGRQHFIDKGAKRDWDKFFSSCGEDPIIEEVVKLLSLLDKNLLIVLLTGRPLSVREETLSWLRRYSLRWDLLIMRNFGDHSAAKEFKSISVDQLRSSGIDPVLAFEDDKRNVEMFREKGIPCVYIHSGYYDNLLPS